MSLSVAPVASKEDREAFVRLPWRIYAGDPNWVPPLLFLERRRFSPRHNAFYQHADVQLFLARRNGEVAGRISAQVDDEHNRFHHERTGFFGFFESDDDPEVAGALLGAAEQWLRERGMERVRGPLSFSINEEAGLLVDGFDSPPVILMPYGRPFYPQLIEGSGYSKAQDLFAWRYDWSRIPARAQRIVDELRGAPEVKVRIVDMKRLDQEVRTLLDIYNDAWSENWGFVPATRMEAQRMARDLRLIADPQIISVIEVDGEAAAVALAIPNLNQALRDLDGRLFPLGIVKLLWRVKVRGLKSGRVMLLGVKKKYRSRRYAGLAYLLCDELYLRGKERGYQWAEFSWTLEDNRLINAMIKNINGLHYKTYRIYEKALR